MESEDRTNGDRAPTDARVGLRLADAEQGVRRGPRKVCRRLGRERGGATLVPENLQHPTDGVLPAAALPDGERESENDLLERIARPRTSGNRGALRHVRADHEPVIQDGGPAPILPTQRGSTRRLHSVGAPSQPRTTTREGCNPCATGGASMCSTESLESPCEHRTKGDRSKLKRRIVLFPVSDGARSYTKASRPTWGLHSRHRLKAHHDTRRAVGRCQMAFNSWREWRLLIGRLTFVCDPAPSFAGKNTGPRSSGAPTRFADRTWLILAPEPALTASNRTGARALV